MASVGCDGAFGLALPLHSSTGDRGTFFWGFAFGPILALDALKRRSKVATVALLPQSGVSTDEARAPRAVCNASLPFDF